MPRNDKNGSIKATYVYDNSGPDIQNLIAQSFALFVEKEANTSYNEANGWLLVGGISCTPQ